MRKRPCDSRAKVKAHRIMHGAGQAKRKIARKKRLSAVQIDLYLF
jgi:hypothetical protein